MCTGLHQRCGALPAPCQQDSLRVPVGVHSRRFQRHDRRNYHDLIIRSIKLCPARLTTSRWSRTSRSVRRLPHKDARRPTSPSCSGRRATSGRSPTAPPGEAPEPLRASAPRRLAKLRHRARFRRYRDELASNWAPPVTIARNVRRQRPQSAPAPQAAAISLDVDAPQATTSDTV